jgi:hypothetical protein
MVQVLVTFLVMIISSVLNAIKSTSHSLTYNTVCSHRILLFQIRLAALQFCYKSILKKSDEVSSVKNVKN